MHAFFRLACAGSALLVLPIVFSPAGTAEPIGKQISIIVAGTAGGGIDLYARMLARHIGRHIPGNPAVVPQDMPGAGGIRAANFLAQKAPRDGNTLGMFPGGPLLEPLIGARNPGYDMSEFRWIGAISRDVSVCVSWGASPFKTIDDVKRNEMIVAGTGAASDTDIFPVVLNELMGTKFKVVTGYLGSRETFLAVESGEAHGRCGLTYSSLKAAKPDWLRDRKLNIMLQLGLAKNADLPDVPLASDLLNSADDRALLELLVTSTAIGRPLAAPPATPPDRVELLRRAFDATMTDPEFLDESRKLQSEISPASGAEVQNIVAKMYATPRSIVDRAKSLLPK
jgi:tripartite-type tricarboxylate transporter receptor subunit TctC